MGLLTLFNAIAQNKQLKAKAVHAEITRQRIHYLRRELERDRRSRERLLRRLRSLERDLDLKHERKDKKNTY